MNIIIVVSFVATALAGISAGYFLRILVGLSKKGSIEQEIKYSLTEARTKAESEAQRIIDLAKKETQEKEDKLKRLEEHLLNKDTSLEKRQNEFEIEVAGLKERIVEIKSIKERADNLLTERQKALEHTAHLTKDEAKNELLSEVEKQHAEDLLLRSNKLDREDNEVLERKAQSILTQAIQKLSTSVYSDLMSSNVTIPTDEMKGKIIGKEGRNIKTFERITGVEVIVDDTPNTITISSFNPLRRHIATITLQNLMSDGRIQPAKIEEFYEKAKNETNKIVKEKGEQAVMECNILNFDPKLTQVIGRLHYRTSYGQNVLQHSIEVSHIAGMIAAEVGANVAIAKAGGLVHDIGKALDHEVQGTHVEIGRKILQKFSVSEDVIKAMQAHHGEYPHESLESVIVQVADAISASRPGARKDSLELYLQRLEDLEQIANAVAGVEKSYVLSAGRELRVFVEANKVNDLEAKKIARNIAIDIEAELNYPGEIKVVVIRETRIIEYAR